MSFGLPHFGAHFKWKEPLPVRHVFAPDPWRTSKLSSKLARAVMAAAPLAILLAVAPFVRSKNAPPLTPTIVAVLWGLAVFIGWCVGFGVPLSNHYTRRVIRIGEDEIRIQSGVKPRASQWQIPVIARYARDDIVSVRFEGETIKGRRFDVIRLKTGRGDSVVIGIGRKERSRGRDVPHAPMGLSSGKVSSDDSAAALGVHM